MTVVPLGAADRRPKPPKTLNKREAAEWTAVVDRMPADWFKREHQPMLESFCSHTCRHRLLRGELEKMEASGLPEDLDRYDKLAKAAERESRSILACARSLRLTHQSQYDPKQAARDARKGYDGPKPWER